MSRYFEFISQELLSKLAQVQVYIKKHNPTIGVLTEEILRDFLRNHLPNIVNVEQGFILNDSGELSRQCDIIVYDSHNYSPFYRVNDIVVVPSESVICVIEVKTTITKQIFHRVINYFNNLPYLENAKTYLFIFNSKNLESIEQYLKSYKHKGNYQQFDHDTFQLLPDEITGINESYHLEKSYVVIGRDAVGYMSHSYEDLEGTEINALQHFYLSIYQAVEKYILKNTHSDSIKTMRSSYHAQQHHSFMAIELFDM